MQPRVGFFPLAKAVVAVMRELSSVLVDFMVASSVLSRVPWFFTWFFAEAVATKRSVPVANFRDSLQSSYLCRSIESEMVNLLRMSSVKVVAL